MPVVLRICHDVEYIWHDQLFTDIFYDIFYEFVRLCYGHFSQSCVPFSLFLQRGLFDQPTAKAFRSNILEKRDSEDPMVLYRRFRGGDPDPDALLKARGLK